MKMLIEPSPALREFVRAYVYDPPGGVARARPIVPLLETRLGFFPGAACRVFDHRIDGIEVLAPAVVIGPQTRRWVDVNPSPQMSGLFVLFRPGGFHRLFNHDASVLADHAYAAADVIGRGITGVLERVVAARSPHEMAGVVEAYLASRVPSASGLHAVDRAAHALATAHGGIRAWTLAERAGLGDRHFRRRFTEHAGMSPKHYAKVARFTFALSLKGVRPALTWTEISQQAGYYDQMHLVKDFKALAAAPPSRLVGELGSAGIDGFARPDPIHDALKSVSY